MPRKKKEDTIELETEKKPKATRKTAEKSSSSKKAEVKPKKATAKKASSKTTTKKATTKKVAKVEKTEEKKTATKKATKAKPKATVKKTTKKSTTAASKKVASKKTTATKKEAKAEKTETQKVATKKVTKAEPKKTTAKKTTKKADTKKATTKKATTKRATTKKSATKNDIDKLIDIVEYYDLPYRYNQTLVKVLYQTPNMLFIYWDISDDDRAALSQKYGDNFFNDTKPVLLIYNKTLNYSFEIDIDDFANSWYLQVKDANCEYAVELGRRPKTYGTHNKIDLDNNYLYITYSNQISIPNDHVLFDKNLKSLLFRNVKTGQTFEENINNLYFLEIMKKLLDLSDVNNIDDFFKIRLTNPSSLSSSNFKI